MKIGYLIILCTLVFICGCIDSKQGSSSADNGLTDQQVVESMVKATDTANEMEATVQSNPTGAYADKIYPSETKKISIEFNCSDFSDTIQEEKYLYGYDIITDKIAARKGLVFLPNTTIKTFKFDGNVEIIPGSYTDYKNNTQYVLLFRIYPVDSEFAKSNNPDNMIEISNRLYRCSENPAINGSSYTHCNIDQIVNSNEIGKMYLIWHSNCSDFNCQYLCGGYARIS